MIGSLRGRVLERLSDSTVLLETEIGRAHV